MRRLGLTPGSPAQRSVLATVRAIADADALPGRTDFETTFTPGYANVRRVSGHNLWVLYRFDAAFVDVLTVRSEPPVPIDPHE
jgi:hypothetical protein